MSSTRFLVESRESRKQKEDTRQAQFIWQSRNQLEKWISRKWETKSSCINYQEIRSANWNNWVSLQIPRHCQFRRSLKWSSCAALWKCLANECAILCHFSLPLFFFCFLALSLGHQCSHVALAALVAKWCLANGSWNQPDALVLNKKPFSRLLFHGKPWYGLRSKIAVYLRFVDFIAELCLQFCLNFITRSATERRWAKGKEICGCVAALDWKWMPKPWYELIFEQGCQVEQTSKGSGAWPSQMDICLHGMDIG